MVEGHGQGLRMEVPAAHAHSFREDQRVVGRRVHLDPEGDGRVGQGRAHGPEDLRDTSQRVGVLHLVRPLVRRDDLAPAEEPSQVRRDLAGAGLRLEGDESVVEGLRGSPQGLEGHRRGDLRVLHQAQSVVDQEGPDARHDGGPVDDREALLRLEDQRLEVRLREGLVARQHASVDLGLAFADQDQAEVGEGRQVPARPEGSAGGDHGMHAAVQELEETGHEDPSHAGIAHRERVRAEEEGRADLVLAEGRSLADRVAPEEVDLQRADVGVGDRDVREFPEPGLDAVREGALRDDLLQGAAARVDALRRGGGEPHRFASAGDRHDVGEVEGPAVDRTHGGPPRHPAASINVFSRTPKTLSARGPSGTVPCKSCSSVRPDRGRRRRGT